MHLVHDLVSGEGFQPFGPQSTCRPKRIPKTVSPVALWGQLLGQLLGQSVVGLPGDPCQACDLVFIGA